MLCVIRKGTNGVSTDGITATFMYSDRGTLWVLWLTYFYLPKTARTYLFPRSAKCITSAAAPLALSPFVRSRGDTMEASLKDATTAENEAVASFEGLVAAKTKEIEALTASIESKTTQIGELGVELVAMKEDLDDSAKGLLQDKKFLAELEHGCATKTGEWEERSKVRSEELVALADTIKMLNDDDALDLFKKTLPSASSSLLQVKESGSAMRNSALNDIHAVMKGLSKKDKVGLQLIALALSGKKALSTGGFDKVVKMIDDMVALLKTEQLDDDHKKEFRAQLVTINRNAIA